VGFVIFFVVVAIVICYGLIRFAQWIGLAASLFIVLLIGWILPGTGSWYNPPPTTFPETVRLIKAGIEENGWPWKTQFATAEIESTYQHDIRITILCAINADPVIEGANHQKIWYTKTDTLKAAHIEPHMFGFGDYTIEASTNFVIRTVQFYDATSNSRTPPIFPIITTDSVIECKIGNDLNKLSQEYNAVLTKLHWLPQFQE
jgi:hypothetical protein